MPCRPPSLST
uniref:Uncharacterized protein n=1 Tax=Rhizophora mucronata TaxID=61149 RepID=A0A2P2NPE7_RHIMU